MQIVFTFVEALPVCSLLALGLGAVVNSIILPLLTNLGQSGLNYTLLVTLITRELGPLLTAVIVIARSATAIATEIATMVTGHEVEAYIASGVDPMEHLAAPRFLGMIISLFLLNIYFSLLGLAGSGVVAQVFSPVAASTYFGGLLNSLRLADIVAAVVKSVIFGGIIALASLYAGFSVERASTEVPVAGLHAVSRSLAGVIVADMVVSLIYSLAV
jgi:phospholipid/cholesterol/gamma-HCH transport system permease protein